MYYAVVNINGTPKYLHRTPTGQYDLAVDKSKAVEFKTGEAAKKAIKNINGKYAFFKDFLEPIDEEAPRLSTTDASRPQKSTFLADELAEITTRLSEELSHINGELTDLEHYIEFRDLDACSGYKAYKAVHDTRKKRRKIKDQLLIINSVRDTINRSEDGLAARQYAPRVRNDIQYFKE